MPNQSSFFRIVSFASFFACINLLILAFLRRPPFQFSHFDIFVGQQVLSSEQWTEYLSYLRNNLAFDSLYLLGSLVMWVGFASVVRTRSQILGAFVLALAIITPGLDFLENEWRWSLVSILKNGQKMSEGYAMLWKVMAAMSFWSMSITALLVGLGVWSASKWDRTYAILAWIGSVSLITVYHFGFKPVFVWMIVFHGLSGIYFWQTSKRTG